MDNGVPLATCLFLFSKWLKELKEQRGLCLMEPGHQYRPDRELCALATWTGHAFKIYVVQLFIQISHTHTPGHPSVANEACYWQKHVLHIG